LGALRWGFCEVVLGVKIVLPPIVGRLIGTAGFGPGTLLRTLAELFVETKTSSLRKRVNSRVYKRVEWNMTHMCKGADFDRLRSVEGSWCVSSP
jgi:hypothetical protein